MKWPLVWRSTFEWVSVHRDQMMITNSHLYKENILLQRENKKLREDLFNAQKNDMPRDQKTGRWKKRGDT